MPTPRPDPETERLRTLHELRILDTSPDEGLDMLVALVKKLTDLLGGRVWVESKASQTCFTIELPIGS